MREIARIQDAAGFHHQSRKLGLQRSDVGVDAARGHLRRPVVGGRDAGGGCIEFDHRLARGRQAGHDLAGAGVGQPARHPGRGDVHRALLRHRRHMADGEGIGQRRTGAAELDRDRAMRQRRPARDARQPRRHDVRRQQAPHHLEARAGGDHPAAGDALAAGQHHAADRASGDVDAFDAGAAADRHALPREFAHQRVADRAHARARQVEAFLQQRQQPDDLGGGQPLRRQPGVQQHRGDGRLQARVGKMRGDQPVDPAGHAREIAAQAGQAAQQGRLERQDVIDQRAIHRPPAPLQGVQAFAQLFGA